MPTEALRKHGTTLTRGTRPPVVRGEYAKWSHRKQRTGSAAAPQMLDGGNRAIWLLEQRPTQPDLFAARRPARACAARYSVELRGDLEPSFGPNTDVQKSRRTAEWVDRMWHVVRPKRLDEDQRDAA